MRVFESCRWFSFLFHGGPCNIRQLAFFALHSPCIDLFSSDVDPLQYQILIFSTAALDESKRSLVFFFFFFRFERLRFSWRRFQLTAWSQQRGLSFRYKSIPHSSPSYWRQAKRRKKLEWVDGGFLKCHTLICQWCVLIPSGDAIDGAEGLKSTVEPAA